MTLHKPSITTYRSIQDSNPCLFVRQPLFHYQNERIVSAKASRAAHTISKLILLPAEISCHTHFLTCVVTLAFIVHLSTWLQMTSDGKDTEVKDQIRLTIGVLKTMSEVWPIAGTMYPVVKEAAEAVFLLKKASDNTFWASLGLDQIVPSHFNDHDNLS
jgi:hypothetical protein